MDAMYSNTRLRGLAAAPPVWNARRSHRRPVTRHREGKFDSRRSQAAGVKILKEIWHVEVLAVGGIGSRGD
jgi:hypothetical protein